MTKQETTKAEGVEPRELVEKTTEAGRAYAEASIELSRKLVDAWATAVQQGQAATVAFADATAKIALKSLE